MSVRESFNPESYELDKNFRLTRFAELKGTGCKVRCSYVSALRHYCIHEQVFFFSFFDEHAIKIMYENFLLFFLNKVFYF